MAERTAIEWTEATWNPWRGCDKVSPGCAHCYMFRDQERYGRDPSVVVRAADSTFYAPLRKKSWQEPRLVITCSWSDWFHPHADPWRDEAWEIIRRTPHTYQILTKRPELIAERLPEDWGEGYPNVWLGVSIENRRFVHRADQLREVPAAVRFISAEPLLGPLIYDTAYMEPGTGGYVPCWRDTPESNVGDSRTVHPSPELDLTDIDWLIVGGESGPNARPMDPQWVRDLRDARQDYLNAPAFFFKQWGGYRHDSGGRVLDGRTWDELPELATTTREA